MTDPLTCLSMDPPTKSSYKDYCVTMVTSFHENELRQKAKENINMKYFNVTITGLRGRHHQAISNAVTVNEVRKMRPHLKMLAGDYPTYETRAQWSGGSPACRLCKYNTTDTDITTLPADTVSHIIAVCPSLSITRERVLSQISALCKLTQIPIQFEYYVKNEELLTQFILDPSSMNLKFRVNIRDPLLSQFFCLSRDLCYLLDKERLSILKNLNC